MSKTIHFNIFFLIKREIGYYCFVKVFSNILNLAFKSTGTTSSDFKNSSSLLKIKNRLIGKPANKRTVYWGRRHVSRIGFGLRSLLSDWHNSVFKISTNLKINFFRLSLKAITSTKIESLSKQYINNILDLDKKTSPIQLFQHSFIKKKRFYNKNSLFNAFKS